MLCNDQKGNVSVPEHIDLAISACNLGKQYPIFTHPKDRFKEILFLGRRSFHHTFWALKSLNLDIKRGTTLGIIGNNGAGKTTLLKLLAKITLPSTGTVAISGKAATFFDLSSGFHPDFTGRENIFLSGTLRGLSPRTIEDRLREILSFSELEHVIDRPIRSYSTGMVLRLGFSVATHLDPDIDMILIDEVFAVGDHAFQQKCLHKLRTLQDFGKTIVLAGHALGFIRTLCHEVLWLDQGQMRFLGPTDDAIAQYLTQPPHVNASNVNQDRLKSETDWRSIEITQIGVVNSTGEESHIFQTGESLKISIAYDAHHPVVNPLFRIQFYRSDGLFISGTNSYRHELNLETLRGPGRIEVFFPALAILEGRYYLSISILPDEFGASVSQTCYDERFYDPIQVKSKRRDGGGIVYQPCIWRCVSQEKGEWNGA